RAANRQRLQSLLEAAAGEREAAAGSPSRLGGGFYASCMDEPRVGAPGGPPVPPRLSDSAAVGTPAGRERVLRRLHALGVQGGLTAAGGAAYQDPSRFVLNVAAGNFGVPRAEGERDAYRKHVAAILALGGGKEPGNADDVVALETRLAEGALDSAALADPAK